MKNIYIILLMLSACSIAQNGDLKTVENVSTVYISDNKTTSIVFDDNIERGVVGNKKFTFGYNKEVPGRIGLLKGVRGPESNLMVITQNGNIYNFTIEYVKDLKKTTLFVKDSNAVGNIYGDVVFTAEVERLKNEKKLRELEEFKNSGPIKLRGYEKDSTITIADSLREKEDLLYRTNKQEYVRKYASNETSKPKFFKRKFNSHSGVYLELKNLVYNRDEIYFTMIIENKTRLDYDVDDMGIYMVARDKNKSTSTQRIKRDPYMIYKEPIKVKGNSKKTFVYVFEKFSIDDKKSVEIELIERRGERNITLTLDVNTINNPN